MGAPPASPLGDVTNSLVRGRQLNSTLFPTLPYGNTKRLPYGRRIKWARVAKKRNMINIRIGLNY